MPGRKTRHGITSFPLILILDPNGKPIGKLEYMEGGPKAFLAELDKVKRHVW